MCRPTLQLAAFAALAPALLAAPVTGAPGATARSQTHPTAKTGSTAGAHNTTQHKTGQTAGNANTIAALQQAHALLAGANHDYEGHRAKAEANITQALHELSGQHHGNAGGAAGNKGGVGAANNPGAAGAAVNKGNANKEPQAQSDAQLRQALQLLNGMQGQLPNTHKAATHVQTAITELNTALKIR